MNPEQLKVIAEGMGYNNVYKSGTEVILGNSHILYKGILTTKSYNPLTDDKQNSELEVKLKIETMYNGGNVWEAEIPNTSTRTHPNISGLGDTPKEARCNAAYNYLK